MMKQLCLAGEHSSRLGFVVIGGFDTASPKWILSKIRLLTSTATIFEQTLGAGKICLGQSEDSTLAFADGFAIAMRRRDSVPERGRDHRIPGPGGADMPGGGDCRGRWLNRRD